MRQLINLCSLSALVLLTACGGINASEKSQASSATGTRTSASTSSAVTTATGTSTQLGSVTIDAAGAATVSAGSKLLVTLTPLDPTAAEQRVLVFDLPASAPLTLPNLAGKSYKLSLQIVDATGKVIATAESSAIAVTAGVATALKTTLTVATAGSTLKIEPVPVVQPQGGSNPVVDAPWVSDSSVRVKREIHYLTTAERQQLSDAILNTKLSKYFYKDGVAHDKSRQLGFIIEDQPADSIFVNDERSHVNLYAFTSGAVAAIQQLKDELVQQQATIKQLKDELERIKEKTR